MFKKFFALFMFVLMLESVACASPFLMPMTGGNNEAKQETKIETPKEVTPEPEVTPAPSTSISTEPEPAPEVPETTSINADIIAEAINKFLVDDDWKFDYDSDKKRFNFTMTIEGKLQRLRYYIYVREDCYTVYAIAPLNADKDDPQALAKMAEFLHRANYGLRNGNFEIDFSDGEIRYKSFVNCDGVLPSNEIINDSIIIPSMMFERYAPGILDMMFGTSTPKDAIEKCEEK